MIINNPFCKGVKKYAYKFFNKIENYGEVAMKFGKKKCQL